MSGNPGLVVITSYLYGQTEAPKQTFHFTGGEQLYIVPQSTVSGQSVAFVEVKARKSAAELDFAIDDRRLARVAAAAEYLMPRFAANGEDIRVDVLLLAPGVRPRHIENAWIG